MVVLLFSTGYIDLVLHEVCLVKDAVVIKDKEILKIYEIGKIWRMFRNETNCRHKQMLDS